MMPVHFINEYFLDGACGTWPVCWNSAGITYETYQYSKPKNQWNKLARRLKRPVPSPADSLIDRA